MPANIFSPLINGEVGRARRMWHSTTNYFSSIDRSSFHLSNVSNQTINTASNVAGVTGGVAGGLTLALSQGAMAGLAGAGFLAAVAGPQVAVTAAVVGVALLAKGAYSNREAAHRSLSHYAWNLVDDQPPQHGVTFSAHGLLDASDAAMTLMDDGKNQIKLLGTKLQTAQEKFARVNTRIEGFARAYHRLLGDWAAVPATRQYLMVARYRTRLGEIAAQAEELWTTESRPGGGIFEYVRRCSHTANYLQAPHIIALGMKERICPSSVVGVAQPDFFAGMTLATNSRSAFTHLDAEYKKIFPPAH